VKVHKNALFHTNISKLFWGWGTAPSPYHAYAEEWYTRSADPTPSTFGSLSRRLGGLSSPHSKNPG